MPVNENADTATNNHLVNKHTNVSAEFQPTGWNPDHVGECLIAAFVTLDRCPQSLGPRGHHNSWPTMTVGEDDFAEIPADKPRNKRPPPSPRELTHMETAFEWLRLLYREDQVTAQMISHWALNAARRRSIRILCQRQGWSLPTFYRKRTNGLTYLANHLNATAYPVFDSRS